MTYAQKLKDPRWQRKRLEVFQQADWQCQLCGDDKQTLHVHHSRYDGREPWDYPISMLISLCEDCHNQHHKKAGVEPVAASVEKQAAGVEPDEIQLCEGLRQLIRLAAIDSESRMWLESQPPLQYEALGEGGRLMEKILTSRRGGIEFWSTLNVREQATIARLDLDRMPDDPLRLAKDYWSGMVAYLGKSAIHLRVLEEKVQSAKARLEEFNHESVQEESG